MASRQTANSASLPRDDDSAPVQVLSPKASANVHVNAVTGSSTRGTLTENAQIVRVAASGPVYLAFGDSTVVAASGDTGSMYFPAGVEYLHLRNSRFTHVAARAATASCVVSVTEME